MALAMSPQYFVGERAKTTIREPVRLAHFQFSNVFVNGGTYKAKSGVNQVVFRLRP